MPSKYNSKSVNKQDLLAAKNQLKEFRHEVALLKRAKLIKNVDARSVKNTGSQGKYLHSIIKKFGNVISGQAASVKVKTKSRQRELKEQGYTIRNGRAIIPKQENEKVSITNQGIKFTTIHPSGRITRINLHFNPKDIQDWKNKINKIKLKNGEQIALQFNGHNFYQTYSTPEQLIERFEIYEDDPEKMDEIITSMAIFKIDRNADWEITPVSQRRSDKYNERRRAMREKWLDRMSPERYNRYMDIRAEREKIRREKIKSNPAKYEQEKEKARDRAAKSYAQRKGK